MKLILSFLLLFATSSAQAACYADIRSCEAYTCLAKELRCGPKNYLLKFGEYYCKQFLKPEVRAAFSKAGGPKVAQIRLCLQEELIADSRLSCRTSKGLAQEHHIKCYVDSGFCDLSIPDKTVILTEVYSELKDPDFLVTTKDIGLACGESWL